MYMFLKPHFQGQLKQNFHISFYKMLKKTLVPCECAAKWVSFEWSYLRISSTDSRVTTTLQDAIIHFGIEMVNRVNLFDNDLL